MYLTTIRIKREGDKPINEQYLVEAVSLTDVDTKIRREFSGVDADITSCKVINFTEVFEMGVGWFYEIKNEVETIDDKKVVELYLQEAIEEDSARRLLKEAVREGEIISFIKKPYKGIIR